MPQRVTGDNTEARSGALYESEKSRDRFVFLAESSRRLADSLEYETTLAEVAALALPYLGAWCIVDIVLPDDGIRRVAVLHPDPARQVMARELHEKYPPRADDRLGAAQVIRTGRAELVADVPDAAMQMVARDAAHLKLLRALGLGAYVIAPMVARGRIVGAITFVTTEDGERFGDLDLLLAEDLARRAAMAVDNARLHAEAVQARERAETASRSKSVFLAAISHELRTPLTSMGLFADTLEIREGGISEEQRRDLNGIRRSQRHLMNLANDVFHYSPAELGAVEFAADEVSLADVLNACVELMVAQFFSAEVALENEACDPTLRAHGDTEKVQQIVLNLLANALKFTEPNGSVVLACTAGVDTVAISVTDSGRGILAISRGFARGMGGDLTVLSVPNEGSVFTLTLPRAPSVELGLLP